MNPETYEDSLTQAERACFGKIVELLGLVDGKDATIAISHGLPDAAVFYVGELGTGETAGFPASAHHFRAKLILYNRDRTMLQRWIMRLLGAFPVNRWYRSDDPVREIANVVHFRISPEKGAVSQIETTSVSSGNSGVVPTWTCEIVMDVVFVCNPDYVG